MSIKRLFQEHWVWMVAGGIVILYFMNSYYSSKHMIGGEKMTQNSNPAYGSGSSGPQPAEAGSNESYSPASASGGGVASSSSSMQDPSDLLPRDNNSQWAQLNPSGKGELSNINLLKAGYHIGIDTVGQTLRNANLQIRSEPANPQMNVGPWNQSTIEPDFMRVPLELGQGSA